MASRVLIGAHPDGSMGLFISKPGVNVLDVGSGDTSKLMFSTNLPQTLNIVQNGTCNMDQDVSMVDRGYLPLIRFDQVDDSFVETHPLYTDQIVLDDTYDRYRTMTRFQIQYKSGGSFRIVRRYPDTDVGTMRAGSYFRYVVFSLPVI